MDAPTLPILVEPGAAGSASDGSAPRVRPRRSFVADDQPGLGEPVEHGLDRASSPLVGAPARRHRHGAGVSSVPSPSAVRRRNDRSRERPAAPAVSPPVDAPRAVFAIAPSTPPASRYPPRVSVRPIRRFQVSSSACESSGSAPGSPTTSCSSGLDQPVLEVQARPAGPAARSRARSSCLASSARPAPGSPPAPPPAPGTPAHGRRSPRAARSRPAPADGEQPLDERAAAPPRPGTA